MNNTASRFTTPALLVAMLACAGSSWADEAYTPTYGEAQVDKSVGTSEYSGATKAQELDTNTLEQLGLYKKGDNSNGANSAAAGAVAGAIVAGSMTSSGAAAHSASTAFTSSSASLIGRSGDIFTFCYEGGEGGSASQGWYPVNPATGTYVITRWCTGSPCPNWQTLNPYMKLCPQALRMGTWTGPGGPGSIGQYQSSGGSRFQGDPTTPIGLRPMPH